MKKIMMQNAFGALALLLVIVGCTKQAIDQPVRPLVEGQAVEFAFSALIPDYQVAQTRANGGVNDLYVLVFDQAGTYITHAQATLSDQTESGGKFKVTLPNSKFKRILHFVSNYDDWANFDGTGANERNLITLMSSDKALFWGRIELANGLTPETLNAATTIDLLRNQAKISVVDNAADFDIEGFAVHQAPARGSVAPYNRRDRQFEVGAITEPAGVALIPASGSSTFDMAEKYLFERRNNNAEKITTVILKARYRGEGTFYYKVDLIDAQKDRYDIERNYHYIVTIKSVLKRGYASLAEALNGASHNNMALDPITEKFPIISDGTSKMEVERALFVLTERNQQVTTWAKYYPTLTGAFDNSDVTISVIQEEDEKVIEGDPTYNKATGELKFTGVSIIPDTPYRASIIIKNGNGDLARMIRVVLRKSYSFNPITINGTNGPSVNINNAQNAVADLGFKIPDDFPADLLPFDVTVETQGLYAASAGGLQMKVVAGKIYYTYRVSHVGAHTLNFKTNNRGNNETIKLTADIFDGGEISYH